jgi:hypothetical protein
MGFDEFKFEKDVAPGPEELAVICIEKYEFD